MCSDEFFLKHALGEAIDLAEQGRPFPLKPMMYIELPPYFRKIYKFPPIFLQFTCLLPKLRFFASPYFDDDAFMHHALHVGHLDASVAEGREGWRDCVARYADLHRK